MSGKRPTVLISGCSTGIGECTAQMLAEKGWTVFAGVRKETDAEKLRGHSPHIKPLFLDVTKQEQIDRAIEEVRVAVGEDGLDALVNNAGMAFSGPTEFISMDDVHQQYDINIFGMIRLTQASMPLIRMGEPGRVINIGSIGAEEVCPYVGIYDSSKAALQTISESFRREVAKWGIKVVLVKPGPVKTNFEEAVLSEHARYMKTYPVGSPCHNLYGKDLEHLPKAAEPFKAHMVEPKIVAERIYQAMTARNPKNIYYDTWGSYFAVQLIYWLPVAIYDYFVGKIFFVKD